MKQTPEIPITLAKDIARVYHKHGVLIFAIDSTTRDTCITTYGTTKKKCDTMNQLGKSVQSLASQELRP